MSARPSAGEQIGSRATNFHEIWYLSTFRKSFEKKGEASVVSDNNNGYFS